MHPSIPTRLTGWHGQTCLPVVFAVLTLLSIGCNSAKVAQPLTSRLGGSDPDAQMEFWHSLADQPLTSNDEAFHGLLLYLDGQDPAADYAGRLQSLKDRRLLDRGFDQPAEQAVQRGTLATALVRALKVRGGVFQRLTNDHPRYAVRELMFLDLYPPSSPQQTFSGTEFLGIIGRIEDYQRGNPNQLPAAVLPGERSPQAASGDAANPQATPATRPAVPTVQPTQR
jgi:hypothetical protein